MAREPKLESFFENLVDENFSVKEYATDRDDLAELLYYADKDNSRQVLDEILEKDEKIREKIVENLTKLYPLTQDIIFEILKEFQKSDTMFLNGFDPEDRVLKHLNSVLKDVKEKRINLTKKVDDYNSKIEKLKNNMSELEDKRSEFNDKIKEKEELEARIEILKKETTEGALNSEVESLEIEEKNLQNQKRRLEEKREQLHKIIDDIKGEIVVLKERAEPGEELDLMRELLQKFPPDAED